MSERVCGDAPSPAQGHQTGALDLTLGRWGVFRDEYHGSNPRFTAQRLLKVTGKQIVARGYSQRTFTRAACVATFETEEAAGRFIQSLDGLTGECVRRQRAAREWVETEHRKMFAKAAQANPQTPPADGALGRHGKAAEDAQRPNQTLPSGIVQ